MTIQLHGFICSPPVYEFKGWLFEGHYNSGPWPLRKDGEPRKRAGDVFWRVWAEWYALPDDEKKLTRVGGGCVRA